MVKTEKIKVKTYGNCQIVDITNEVTQAVQRSEIRNGTVTIFNVGSTAAVTTIEFEPGLVNCDIDAALEKIAPQNGYYEQKTWRKDAKNDY